MVAYCFLAILAFSGCHKATLERSAAARPPIVLISLDTMRADHLFSYGYARETTPNLDRWAREEAVLFENAITPETWTLPAHMSMFTGLYPQHHAVTRDTPLGEGVTTLPELLREHGYATAGFTGHSWWLRADRGFGQGMDHYDNAGADPDKQSWPMLRPIQETKQALSDWLTQPHEKPPFIFFHAYDLHAKIREMGYELPYGPEPGEPLEFAEPYLRKGAFQEGEKASLKASELLKAARDGNITFTENEQEAILALYDDALHMVDHAVAEIFSELKSKGLYDDALIVVTSDHGEGLGERGYYDHEDVWEEEARVPLIIKLPHGEEAGKRIKEQVQAVDLFSTIATVAGIDEVPKTDGINLIDLIRGTGHGHPLTYIRNGAGRLGVRSAEWKLHWHPQGQNDYLLFNLEKDPREQENKILEATAPAKLLKSKANHFFGLAQAGWHIEVVAPRDTPWRAQLTAKLSTPLDHALHVDSWGNVQELKPKEATVFSVELGAAAPEHLVLPVAGPGTLEIEITSESQFHYADATTQEEQTSLRLSLDSGTTRYSRPESNADATVPAVNLWFIPPKAEEDATEISPETMEQLRDLGYL